MTTVVLAVEDPVFRAGLAMMVDADATLELTGEADTVERLWRLLGEHGSAVVLLDLHLADLQVPEQLRPLIEGRQVYLLAKYLDDPKLNAALPSGPAGFVVRSDPPGQILRALRGQSGARR